MSVCKGWFGNCKICFVMKLQVMLCYGFSKSFDSIAIVFLSELVLVTVGVEVDNILLTDQTTGGQIAIF